MNPLCCIAPISVHGNGTSASLGHTLNGRELGLENFVRSANLSSGARNSASAAFTLKDGRSVPRESETCSTLGGKNCGLGSIGGILYKWVNYGKRWRARWFLLEDGVLSYYKIHGPDKIVMSQRTVNPVKVIGYASRQYMMKSSWVRTRLSGMLKRWKPFGEMHLKVSSIHASKSDVRRLSIFTGTKTLHLQCLSSDDRTEWLEALHAAKDLPPRILRSSDLNFPEEIIISTEKLRLRLQMEGIVETAIKDCESILLLELSGLHNKLLSLRKHHEKLLNVLRHLEKERMELEATVVNPRESCCDRRVSDFYSIAVEESDSGGESEEERRNFFDTNDFLRNASSWHDPASPSMAQHYGYPRVRRRRDLPEPKESERPVCLWSVIKDNIGKDLTGVCLPVYFNEPLSSLQKCFEDLEHSYLLDAAAVVHPGDHLGRVLNVAAFAVSAYASTQGRRCKPFNPLLGETYEADYPDKGLRFVSEKVSNDPMVVAWHCEGRGWKYWGDSRLRGRFWGRSIQVDPVGVLTVEFDDGETLRWSKVTTSIYNVVTGDVYCDHYGTMRVDGSGRYSCTLRFKEQCILDGDAHRVRGLVEDRATGARVAALLGKWDEALYYLLGDPTAWTDDGYDPMAEAVLLWEKRREASVLSPTRYNFSPFAISLNEITPGLREKLPPTDSRFRPDQRSLENGEYEHADSEKLRLEKLQCEAGRLQENGWEPRWFPRDRDGGYHYKGGYWEARERGDWSEIPDIFAVDDVGAVEASS